jgi:hypothetical protein
MINNRMIRETSMALRWQVLTSTYLMSKVSNSVNSEEPLAKSTFAQNCHSERSEESCIYKGLRSFTPFRMTKPTLLQEPQRLITPAYTD